MCEQILDHPNIGVIPQTHESFLRGLALYRQREDKGYSLTDCISMSWLLERGIQKVLTHDNHFTQEGFTVLL
jgi:predicted nucleic acid-binding protein